MKYFIVRASTAAALCFVMACSPAQRTAAATVADVADRLCAETMTADACARRVHQRMVELDGRSLLEDICKR